MITRPTVFVLGAGTSMPYGFPSGRQLIEQIYQVTKIGFYEDPDLDSNDYNVPSLIHLKKIREIIFSEFSSKDVEDFSKSLLLSQQVSIDAFLEHRPEFIQLGKLCIALFVLRKEIGYELFSFENREKGFYQHIFNKLNTGWDEFRSNRVAFITFNYDRSLEHFLFTSLKHKYNKVDLKCAEQVNNIPIVHVHGSLGKLMWQSENNVPFGTIPEENTYKRITSGFDIQLAINASQQIKIITEDQSESGEFQSAFRFLSEAERIYFLSFGYNPTNLDRLQVSSLPKLSESGTYKLLLSPMKGTAKDLQDAEVRLVQDRWHIQLPDTSSDSLMFLRKYADLS